MTRHLQARVAGALTNVRNPRVDNDVISSGMIRDLVVGDEGRVSFTFVLSREDPAHLVREARQAVREIDGVTDVRIEVVEPSGSVQEARTPIGTAPAVAAGTSPPASTRTC